MVYAVPGSPLREPEMFRDPPELLTAAQLENSEVLPLASVAVAATNALPPATGVRTGAFCKPFAPLVFDWQLLFGCTPVAPISIPSPLFEYMELRLTRLSMPEGMATPAAPLEYIRF